MNSEQRTEEIEIDLVEVCRVLLHKAWIWILCGIAVGAAGWLISKFLVTPQYESTTKVYVLNRQNGDTLTLSDTQLATQLTQDYEKLIISRTVLESIIEEFQLDEKYESLADRVSVINDSGTRILAITVQDKQPEMAQKLADAIRNVSAERIKQVMDIEAVNIVDEANLPSKPSKPSVMKWTVVAMCIGMFGSMAVIFLQYMLDDTITTTEDVENHLKLSTLAMIPLMDEGNGKRKKNGKNPQKDAERAPVIKAVEQKSRQEISVEEMDIENL